ncbi:glycosyltransferase family 4 protein [Desulfococcaceae bacterium HSG7]|nr:glycosyltransferase family 4 protein [Desulfococcaceae bacterium HSG7]
MKILYISYVKYGAGWWVHTTQFLTAIRSLHNDILSYTPLAASDAKSKIPKETSRKRKSDQILNPLREIRYLSMTYTRRAWGEIRQLKRFKPDVVIVRWQRYLSGLILCRLFGIPVIIEQNGPALEDTFTPRKYRFRWLRFWQWFEICNLKLADHIMTVSEPLKQYYINRGLPSGGITTVPNGVDINMFHPRIDSNQVKRKLGLEGKLVVGFAGHFSHWHGLDFLAKAMKKYLASASTRGNYKDNIALLLIGSKETHFIMPDLPEGRTIITGYVPHTEMPLYLDVIDIFIAPYPRIEPFYFSPLKIFEAMSMGKPVLASAQGQICELIDDNISGLLYPPDDMTVFLKKLDLAVKDKKLRSRMGHNARQKMVQHFTWADNASRVLNICKRFDKKYN